MADPLDYYRDPIPARPNVLTIVAWLSITMGILAAVGMITDMFAGQFSVDGGVLGIFVGRGLLNRRAGWRTCALVMLWLSMAGAVLMAAVVSFTRKAGSLTLYGIPRISLPWWAALLLAGLYFSLALWQYRVLVRPDVKDWFAARQAFSSSPIVP